jgi:hypothetical protein
MWRSPCDALPMDLAEIIHFKKERRMISQNKKEDEVESIRI